MVPPTAIAEASRSGGEPAIKDPVKDTILTPRFYTTDFEAMAAMDLRPNQEELEAICEEFRKDYNRHHFVRNEAFEGAADKLDPETRRVFVEFLEQSCTSEFSGFLLYKELSRRIKQKNPLLAECFAHMARDEADHCDRQRLCEERRDQLDSWLEAQWLEDCQQEAGQECRTLAASGRSPAAP